MTISSRRTKRARRVAALTLSSGIAALGAVALGRAYAADWPQLRGNPQRTGVSSENVPPPLTLLWRFTGGLQSTNVNSPVIAGDTAYFTTRLSSQQGGVLYAVDVKTGARKWVFPNESGLTGGGVFTTTPTVADGKLYVGSSDGGLYVVEAGNGREIVKLNIGSSINSSPIYQDNNLYFGANNGTFYALNPETGERAWRQLYNAGDGVNSAPIIADSMVLFTTSDNSVHGLKQAVGSFRWKYRLPFTFQPNSMIYADGSIYIPTGPRLFAIQPTSGNVRWSVTVRNDILTPPVAVEGIVYVVCRDDQGSGALLYAIREGNGRPVWKDPKPLPAVPSGAPIVSGNTLYFATTRGVLMAVTRDEGQVTWQYRMQASSNRANATLPAEVTVGSPLAVSGGTLYVVSNDGTLSAFRADAPDSTGPTASELYPRPGTSVSGKPPFICAAKFVDYGTGVDADSISVRLDDREIKPTYDQNKNLVYIATQSTGRVIDPPLANGRHTVTFSAKDYRGNVTDQTWSFVVDNSLPPSTRQAPVAPRTTTPPTGGTRPGGTRPGGTRPGGTGTGNPPRRGFGTP